MKTQYICGLVIIGLVSCKPADKGTQKQASSGGAPSKTATIEGFQTPESVLWDSAQDVYFVSNINGAPNAKDKNGYISVVMPDGTIRDKEFIKGLNAPKGMALVHDTLWVTDIDVVRAFEARTGAPVTTVQAPGALFLNDIAVAPDGSLYITDTAVRFGAKGVDHPGTDQIFQIQRDHKINVAIKSDSLGRPNGITWDGAHQRFIVVPFGASTLLAWKPGETTVTKLETGAGQFDGVEISKDGALWVTSWTDSSVYRYAGGQGSNLIKGVPGPADIGYDAKRNRILIPSFMGNRVEVWHLQ